MMRALCCLPSYGWQLPLLQAAEVRMNLEQLRAFVSSSRKLGHSDKQIADYLKNIKLTERLDAGAVEDIGAGPKDCGDTSKACRNQQSTACGSSAGPLPRLSNRSRRRISVEQARVLDAARNYARDYEESAELHLHTGDSPVSRPQRSRVLATAGRGGVEAFF